MTKKIDKLELERMSQNPEEAFVGCSAFELSFVMLTLIYEENSIMKQKKCGLFMKGIQQFIRQTSE